MVKYSIIVPVYNLEKYIEECLKSLIKQTFNNFEIIVVDDGSKDSSYSICEKFAKTSDKIKLYKKENGGVSSARNLGIEKSRGQYILFVDGDDFVSNDYLEVIDKNLKEDEFLTFFHYSFIEKKDNTTEITLSNFQKRFTEKNCKADSLHDFIINTFFASPWNKVYRKDIIKDNNILFDLDCVCFEDLLFNVEYLKYINKTSIIENGLYYYRTSESINPISKRKWGEPFVISKKVIHRIQELCKIDRYKKELSTVLLYAYMALITELTFIKLTNKDYQLLLNKIIKDKDFIFTIEHLKKAGKKLFIIKILLKLKFYTLASKILDGMIK